MKARVRRKVTTADKRAIINSLVIFLRSGVDPDIDKRFIISFLKQHDFIGSTSNFTLRRYIHAARQLVKSDFHTNAWLTEKVQDAMVKDYQNIWMLQDKVIKNLDNQLTWIEKDARRVSGKIYEGDEKRYYEFIDAANWRASNTALQDAIHKKLELMKAGFIQFKFKRYVEALQEARSNPNKEQLELETDPIIAALNKSPMVVEQSNQQKVLVDTNTSKEKPDFELAEHLKPFEEKLNKKLSSLEE